MYPIQKQHHVWSGAMTDAMPVSSATVLLLLALGYRTAFTLSTIYGILAGGIPLQKIEDNMPLVTMTYRDPLGTDTAQAVAESLQDIVSTALTCDHPQGSLKAEDVEVDWNRAPSNLRSSHDLRIIVEANSYPQRVKNLKERCEIILNSVTAIIRNRSQRQIRVGDRMTVSPPVRISVWVRCAEGSFKENTQRVR